jgi:hypothetical protein
MTETESQYPRCVVDERAFNKAMRRLYDEARAEGYQAGYFLKMLAEHGGVATAKQLINSSTPSEGFARLWELGRLDLTVEALALEPEWRALFTREELQRAETRLREYGWNSR